MNIPCIGHIPIEANKAAYSVVNHVAQFNECHMWFEVGLSWFMQIVTNDLPVTNYCFWDVRGSPIFRVMSEDNIATCHSTSLESLKFGIKVFFSEKKKLYQTNFFSFLKIVFKILLPNAFLDLKNIDLISPFRFKLHDA